MKITDTTYAERMDLVLSAINKSPFKLDRVQISEKTGLSSSILDSLLVIIEKENIITGVKIEGKKQYSTYVDKSRIAGPRLFFPLKQPIYQSPTTGIFATMTPRKPQPVIETKPAPIAQVTSEKVFDVCGMKVEITTNEKIKRFPIHKYDLVFNELKVGEFLKCNEENLNAFRNAMVNYVKRKKLKNRVFSSLKIKDGYGRLWLE